MPVEELLCELNIFYGFEIKGKTAKVLMTALVYTFPYIFMILIKKVSWI
jgi:hypothetical protein